MTKKVMIPLELKYDFAITAYASVFKGFMYAIREEYGAAASLKMYERLCKMGDRIKNITNFIKNVFKLEGNDAESIEKWWEVWYDLLRFEYTIIEQSKTIRRVKITKCPVKTDYKDISDWCLIFSKIIDTTLNQKAIVERPKGMCAGDPYCEYVTKIEE